MMNPQERRLSLALTALQFALPLLLPAEGWELHRDEYLYFEQGRHLAPGFLENPPFIALLASISHAFGGAAFWIKIWPALFGAMTLWLALRIAKGFGGDTTALLFTGTGFLLSAFLRIHYLFQPNFTEVFSWTLATFFLQRYLSGEQRRDLFLLAGAVVLGWYSKYSVLFFGLALLMALLLTPQRRWLLRRDFWQAAGMASVFLLPNLWWQHQHHWPLAQHMRELRSTQLQYLSKTDFLKEQVLMFLPACFLCAGGLFWLFRSSRFRLFGWLYAGIIALLLAGSGKGYYALGIYPMVLAAGGAWFGSVTKNRTVVLRAAALLLMVSLGTALTWLLLPLQSPERMAATNQRLPLREAGLLRWEDRKDHALQQDFADMIGWQELAQKTWRFYHDLPPHVRDSTVVYARNYGFAGSLLYWIRDTAFRKKVICDNGTFLLWIPDQLPYRHLLFVGESIPRKEDDVFGHFSRMQVVDSCTKRLSRQYGSKVVFYSDADTAAFRIAERGLREMKARFGR